MTMMSRMVKIAEPQVRIRDSIENRMRCEGGATFGWLCKPLKASVLGTEALLANTKTWFDNDAGATLHSTQRSVERRLGCKSANKEKDGVGKRDQVRITGETKRE